MSGYTTESMRVLHGLEPIRQNPAQYVGDISAVSAENGRGNDEEGERLTAGGFHLFVETLSNATDEATNSGPDGKPFADRVRIELRADQSITVTDNGRGLPPEHRHLDSDPVDPKTGEHVGPTGIELAYLVMSAGGKFKDKSGTASSGSYKSSAGLHGVGAACVAALSDRLSVKVWRDGTEYELQASRGIPGRFEDGRFRRLRDGEQAVTSRKDARPAAERKAFPHGTSVTWHPDPSIWGGTDIPYFDIWKHVHEQAYMAPDCTFEVVDGLNPDADGRPTVTEIHEPDGITGLVRGEVAGRQAITPVISVSVPTSYEKDVMVDVESSDGQPLQERRSVTYGVTVKAALCWLADGGDPVIDGYANGVHCAGRHVEGLKSGTRQAVLDLAKSAAKKSDPQPNQADALSGLVAAVEVIMDEQCYFTSQTKDVLNNAEVQSVTHQAIKEQLSLWASQRKNSKAAKALAKSVIEAAKLRTKLDRQKAEAKKVRKTLSASAKPAKLYDCRLEGKGTEILLVEGNSAGGTLKMTRDPNTQAILPLRGVTLNAYGASAAKILANSEFASLVSAMNAGIGKTFDMDSRRYESIGVYTDSDNDGDFIRSLLLVAIFEIFPGLIENGHVFSGMPPLYSVHYVHGRKAGQTAFLRDEAERDRFIEKYVKDGGKTSDLDIQRSKGLGESSADEFKTCLNPKTRQVRVITLDDVADARKRADDAMRMLFGKADADKQERRAWIDDTFEEAED